MCAVYIFNSILNVKQDILKINEVENKITHIFILHIKDQLEPLILVNHDNKKVEEQFLLANITEERITYT